MISEGLLQMVLVVRVRLTRKPVKKKIAKKTKSMFKYCSRRNRYIGLYIDCYYDTVYAIRQFAEPEKTSYIRPTRGYDSKCDGLNSNTGKRASAALRSSLLSCAARVVFSFRASTQPVPDLS